MNKILTLTSIIVLALSILPAGFYVRSVAAQTKPKIRIEPVQIMKVPVGETFTVNVTVEDCVNVYAVQVYIRYDPEVLEAVSILEGPFLPSFGSTLLLLNETKEDLEATPPYAEVRFTDSLMGDVPGANGSGLLFNVTFRVLSDGSSHLHFVEYVPKSGGDGTYFVDRNSNEIYPELYDGFYGTGVVEWTGTVYIRADGSIDPSDAPIITDENVTYTLTDNITSTADGIIVERDNIIIDGAGYVIQGISEYRYYLYRGIDLTERSNVTIKNVTIMMFCYGIYLNFSTYNSISGNDIKNNVDGIKLEYSSNNVIYKNNITESLSKGLYLDQSSNNSIIGNNIKASDLASILLDQSSNNRIAENNIANNYEGIVLVTSFNNNIIENTIKANNLFGISSFSSSGNNISGNSITNNRYGIELMDNSSNNTIWRNNIVKNDQGIVFGASCNNIIFHNNFIDNALQVYDLAWEYPPIGPSINIWDNGYPGGGNYWNDYTGIDLYSGPYQNLTGNDGIGDTQYTIDANNVDSYPLMAPFKAFETGVWDGTAYNVDVLSNSTVSDFKFNVDQKSISFNVSGDDGTIGFCRVTIPKSLLWVDDGWTILVDSQSITDYTKFEDENFTYLYFTYTHSTKTVTIKGTNVIPEFPSTTILTLFLLTTTILVILTRYRRLKHRK
jgi:parallel beta-helix repeat protein